MTLKSCLLQRTLVVRRGSPSTPIEQQLGTAEQTQPEEEGVRTQQEKNWQMVQKMNSSSPFYHQLSDTGATMSSFSTVIAREPSHLRLSDDPRSVKGTEG